MPYPYQGETSCLLTAVALTYIDCYLPEEVTDFEAIPALDSFFTGLNAANQIASFQGHQEQKHTPHQSLYIKKGGKEVNMFGESFSALYNNWKVCISATDPFRFQSTIDLNFKVEWLFLVVDYVASSDEEKGLAGTIQQRFYNSHYSRDYDSPAYNSQSYNVMKAKIEKFWQCFEVTLLHYGYKVS